MKTKLLGMRNRLFIVGILISLIIVFAIYVFLPSAKVYRVAVRGNYYLDDDHYRLLSGIDDDDLYYFVFDNLIEGAIAKDPLIKDVKAWHLDHNVIALDIEEKKIIAYTYDDEPYLIDEDGGRISLEKEYYDLISMVPLLEGYDVDEIGEIARGFKNVDDDLIGEISEIHAYPFSYDERMMELVMRSGNYVYVSYYGLELLNNYPSIEANIVDEEGPVCIFLDEVTNSGYTSACPYWSSEDDEEKDDQEEVIADEAVEEIYDTDADDEEN